MGFELLAEALKSREIRQIMAPAGRKIANITNFFTDENISIDYDADSPSDVLQRSGKNTWNLAKKVVGFIWTELPGLLSFTAQAIFGWIISATTAIVNFDWNASDEALSQRASSAWLAATGAWGAFVGVTGGTIIGGALGAGIAYYLPIIGGSALAAKTLLKVVEERGDEVLDELRNALRLSANAILASLAIGGYVWLRRGLKAVTGGPLSPLKNWGAQGGASWTIAEAFEETIDSIDNPYIRTFIEEAIEEGIESFIETGYVVARLFDDELANAKANAEQILGGDTTAIIDLDRGNSPGQGSDERMKIINLPSNLAVQSVTNAITNHRLLRDKEIGNFEDPDDSQKVLQPYLRTAKIIFRGEKDKPPFIDVEGNPASRHQITLKSLKPDLRWRDFKKAFRSLRWGPWKIESTLKSRVTITLFAEDREAGKFTMREILDELIEEDAIRTVVSFEEVDPRIAKVPKTVYPEKAIITLKRESVAGRVNDLAGTRYEQQRIEFRLWQDEEPYGTPDFVTRYPIEN